MLLVALLAAAAVCLPDADKVTPPVLLPGFRACQMKYFTQAI